MIMTIALITALIITALALIICLIIFAVDAFPVAAAWLGRIHIGRFSSDEERIELTKKAALGQIKKLPPMPVTDRTAYTLLPRLKGEYANRNFNCWQEACLLLGLSDDESAKKYAYAYFEKADLPNSPYTVGNAMLIYSLLISGFDKDEKVKKAADIYVKTMLRLAGEGTLPYNPGGRNRFVDTLGMVCPLLFTYDRLYGCAEARALAVRQTEEYFEFGVHPLTGLPAHCFDVETKYPSGSYAWGRGCGWLAVALADSYLSLAPDDDYGETLKAHIASYARSLLSFSAPDGGFNCVMGQDSRFDSSATAFIGWSLAVFGKVCSDSSFTRGAEACRAKLAGCTRRSGKVDFAQGDTIGVGNYSRRFDIMPAAQGFTLRLENELR